MNYLEQIQKLVQEKIDSQSPEERLEKLNSELKKKNPDLSLIETLIQKGVGKKMTFESVKEKIEQKKRLEKLNTETKKLNPDLELIESLLEKGVGKKMTMEKVKEAIEKNPFGKMPMEFEQLVGKLSKRSTTSDDSSIKKIKKILSIKEVKVDVELALYDGKRLIHYAVNTGDVELAQLLIDRGADLNTKGTGDNWRRPADWRPAFYSQEVFDLIKRHGAENET